MSFAIFQQLTHSTVVDFCAVASLTGVDSSDIVLCKSNRLEVHTLDRRAGRLSLAFAAPLFGAPEALGIFRPPAAAAGGAVSSGLDHVAVVLRRARYLTVLRPVPDLGSFRTCGQHVLIPADDPACAVSGTGFRPQIAVDPGNRCLAIRVLPDRVLIFPVGSDLNWQREAAPSVHEHAGGLAFHEDAEQRPGLGAPFAIGARSPLRLHHIQDIAFVHGYHQATAVCLGQAKPAFGGCLNEAHLSTSSVLMFTLDLVDRSPRLIWAWRHMPHDLFRLVPLPAPSGGVLGLCSNAVISLKEHGESFCQMLNPCSSLGDEFSKLGMEVKDETKLDILLSGCEVAALSPSTLLFSVQPAGRLYLAHLVFESREVIADIVWTSPGTAPSALGLLAMGEDFVFLPALAGGSVLLKGQPTKKKLPPNLQRHRPAAKRQRTEVPGGERPQQQEAEDVAAAEAKDGAEAKPKEGALSLPPSEARAALAGVHEALRHAGRFIRSFTFTVSDDCLAFGPICGLSQWVQDPSAAGGHDDSDAEDDDAAGAGGPPPAPLRGSARLIFCSGEGQRGALHICQRAVPLELLTEFDLPEGTEFSAVWTLPHPPEDPVIVEAEMDVDVPGTGDVDKASAAAAKAAAGEASRRAAGAPPAHRLAVVSGGFKSMILLITGEIEEISKSTTLDVDATTLCIGGVLGQRAAVQVTPRRLAFMDVADPKSSTAAGASPSAAASGGRPPELAFAAAGAEVGSAACGASVCEPYVAVRFHDFSLRLFAVCVSAEPAVELTSHLPAAAKRGVVAASLHRDRSLGRTFLLLVTGEVRGTLRAIDLGSMEEVFHSEHLLDAPPVLRNHIGGDRGCCLDHLRAVTDVCAPIPRATESAQLAREKETRERDAAAPAADLGASAAASICGAELVEVDVEDAGPTLVVLLVGRPVLLYRAFLPGRQAGNAAFPYHFSLFEHDLLGLVARTPSGPHRPVAVLRGAGGVAAGAVVHPPHAGIPCLWLTARRNELFVHPLPGTRLVSISDLSAPCCGHGFFAISRPEDGDDGPVAAQVFAPATASGLKGDQAAFELRGPLPVARKPLQRTPHVLAVHTESGNIGLAVSETVLEAAEPVGVSVEEDPLGEDWSIVREPPVPVEPPPMPRAQPRFELWIENAKELSKIGRYRFTFDSDEHVLCMEWISFPGFPNPSLAVGTGVNVGEDLTCRGRLLIFSAKDRAPGIVPAIYQRSLKWPVTVIKQFGSYLVHSEGFKLFFERWEKSNFHKVAFFDASMCITSMSSIKNFLLLGDLRKGLDFVQWKDEGEGQTRSLRRLSRSPPSAFMTVLSCDFMVCGKSLGLLALDHVGTAHLFQYSPHSDGREGDQLLRSCATFSMGPPCRAAIRVQTEPGVQSIFAASGGGELLCFRPIDDQVYRTAATLGGMLATRLPFRGGLNPRAFRHHDGPPVLVAPRKNIEDAVLVRLFAFLSGPLQAPIAEKMRMPILALAKATLPFASCQLFDIAPPSAAAIAALPPAPAAAAAPAAIVEAPPPSRSSPPASRRPPSPARAKDGAADGGGGGAGIFQ